VHENSLKFDVWLDTDHGNVVMQKSTLQMITSLIPLLQKTDSKCSSEGSKMLLPGKARPQVHESTFRS
jgi:hypothetical protein